MRRLLSIATAIVFAGPAVAQDISIEDLQAQIDAELAKTNPYEDLLNDPDPERSLAAMNVMLASGDPELERMALNFGLYSPNPAVRRIALDAFFATGPLLSVIFDGSDKDADQFKSTMQYYYNNTPTTDGTGTWMVRVGEWDSGEECFTRGNDCFVRITNQQPFIMIGGEWTPMTLGDDGYLRGIGDISKVPSTPFAIPVDR